MFLCMSQRAFTHSVLFGICNTPTHYILGYVGYRMCFHTLCILGYLGYKEHVDITYFRICKLQ